MLRNITKYDLRYSSQMILVKESRKATYIVKMHILLHEEDGILQI